MTHPVYMECISDVVCPRRLMISELFFLKGKTDTQIDMQYIWSLAFKCKNGLPYNYMVLPLSHKEVWTILEHNIGKGIF